MIDERDRRFLDRALELACRSGRRPAPNPRVGAVLVRGERVLGEGWHRRAGEPHAEVVALAEAGDARGATLYTSLEPCAHQGRTPPCTDAIRAAGVVRVVAALEDPDPRVAGHGVEMLRRAGIAVELAGGELARRAEQVNEDYLVHRRRGRAFAALKVAATLDGRIGDRSGASRWITGAAARARGRALRDRYGAVLVGAGTVIADDPRLSTFADDPAAPPFLRCILDGRLRIPISARALREPSGGPVVVYARSDAPEDRRLALERAGAEVVALGSSAARAAPRAVLEDLARRGVLGVLVEGGGRTHGSFITAGVADKLYWFVAPRVLGDSAARSAVAAGRRGLAQALDWEIELVERLERDILLVLRPAVLGE